MNSVFSVDDTDPFWQPTPTMNRSASQWALEQFLEEFTGSSSSSASSAASESTAKAAAAASVASSKLLDDDVMEVKKPQISPSRPQPHLQQQQQQQLHQQHPLPHPRPLLDRGNPSVPADSDEYRAFLKSKLDLACAAVAMSRASSVKPEDFPPVPEDQMLARMNSLPGSLNLRTGPTALREQSQTDGGSLDAPALPAVQRKQEVLVRQATSGSSRDDSDDDDLEGETETNGLADPADAKRARRMQSNRESARRSRRRKQEQLSDLETQVGALRDERTSLLTRFTDINQKCDEASVDNRILKADIETLRAKGVMLQGTMFVLKSLYAFKDVQRQVNLYAQAFMAMNVPDVKMAEEQVKRVTGLNPMILARPNMPGMGMQFVSGQMNSSANNAGPMQANANQYFHQPVPPMPAAAPHLQGLNNNFPNSNLVPLPTNPHIDNGTSNVGGMTPMQLPSNGPSVGNMPAMHNVQKQIGPTVGPGGPLPVCEPGLPHTVANDNLKK
ncbi:hypothetical protein Tsubulata_004973 [Turnera subulata]|uniref:BZIP domain-containing protein n=1 Tax=Turnera subulata TaxID=218843 RepID=A0A9Q0J505_9ROSI|nr:hypothetical protein Tsubulata_004973 [Turnera subulata]